MKRRLYIILLAFLFAFDTPIGRAVQNPSTTNPAGYTTVPQSYIRSSLVNTSNPVNLNGNQIVTGNVRRGMSFRGNVPYQSTSSFSSTLGSASLNSFMRDSAGSEDIGNYSSSVGSAGANYQSYQLPSSTVTTMSQVNPKTSIRANTTANNNTQYVSGSNTYQNLPNASNWNNSARPPVTWQLYNPGSATAQTQYESSATMTPRTNEQRTPNQNIQYQSNNMLSSQQYNQQQSANVNTSGNLWNNSQYTDNQSAIPQQNQSLTGLQNTTNQTSQPPQTSVMNQATSTGEQNLMTSYRPGNLEQSLPVTNYTRSQYETDPAITNIQKYQAQSGGNPNANQNVETSEAIERIQKQLDDLIKSIDYRLENPTDYTSQYTTTVQDISTPSQTDTSYRPGQATRDFSGQSGSNLQNPAALPGVSEPQIPRSNYASILDRPTQGPAQTPQSEISDRAKSIMGEYDSYESFSQSKYQQLYRAAEGHLNIGRFHQAADAFTLAAIYKPDDPACYGGRGHALFAAGEYVSSALCIIRAIEIDPQYIANKIDFVELLGDTELLNNRIAELQKWLHKSNAPGLGFLLCYVYYQTGNLDKANQLIDVVCREMPQSRAATTLKTAIDFKLKVRQ
ncbi:MAG: tetratricopeptide repeat protein [Sedimentisphaerales bacterium]|nr:tetratricopeptide repeat protein [Sedimentisphaerales bacterium]